MRVRELFENDNFSTDPEYLAEKILADCRPYLSEITYDIDKVIIYRGMKIQNPALLNREFVRKDRRPLNTSRQFSAWADDWFNNNFGFWFRSQAIFGIGNKSSAADYGEPFIVFPIGSFHYCYSAHYSDLTENLSIGLNMLIHNDREKYSGITENTATRDMVEEVLDKGHYTCDDGDLKQFVVRYKYNEIMIDCKEYYAIPISRYENEYKTIIGLVKDHK